MPSTRAKEWYGTNAELTNGFVLWEMNTYGEFLFCLCPKLVRNCLDPDVDVKKYDPKVIVIKNLDSSENLVKRFHSLDLSECIRYNGIPAKKADEDEVAILPEDAEINDLDSKYLITISVLTRPLVKAVILTNPKFHEPGTCF